MLVNAKTLLKKAQKGKYAVPHLNITGLEALKALVSAAEKKKSPVIIATSQGAIKYFGHELVAEMVKIVAKNSKVPIALHLDHGTDMEIIKNSIKYGYTSIMIDGSSLSYKDNISKTRKVVRMCKSKRISVEAELGVLAGIEDDVVGKENVYTDPDQAKDFVKKTGCDSLAIAIGTSHGAYKFSGSNNLRIDILKEVRKRVSIPLVLHGASHVNPKVIRMANKYGADLKGAKGVSNEDIVKSIRNGICKINVNTDFRLGFDAAIRKFLYKNPKEYLPKKIYDSAIDMMEQIAIEKIDLFKSKGKA